ncbi:MAG: MarR family transcriptional regulator [Roseburia sp.]|nr:MarR family transcriptional regulator [Roseburia sp.]
MDKYEVLKLANQICFPLYVSSKEIVKRYTPFLDEIDLTYTQYITMMVLWEYEEMNVKELGKHLYLDSGTLTPVLKKLEQKGYVSRKRDTKDERVLNVAVTPLGMELREKALDVPAKIGSCIDLSQEDALKLHEILHRVLKNFE